MDFLLFLDFQQIFLYFCLGNIAADIQVMENMMAAEGLSGGRDFDTK